MSEQEGEGTDILKVIGALLVLLGPVIVIAKFGLVVGAWIIGALLSMAWAIAVLVLLSKILQRLPAPPEEVKTIEKQASSEIQAEPDPPSREKFTAGLYEVKRDERGRGLAD
jgi:hypothetical protein